MRAAVSRAHQFHFLDSVANTTGRLDATRQVIGISRSLLSAFQQRQVSIIAGTPRLLLVKSNRGGARYHLIYHTMMRAHKIPH